MRFLKLSILAVTTIDVYNNSCYHRNARPSIRSEILMRFFHRISKLTGLGKTLALPRFYSKMGTGCIKIMGSGYVLLLSPLPSTVRCRARGLRWKRCRLGSEPWCPAHQEQGGHQDLAVLVGQGAAVQVTWMPR